MKNIIFLILILSIQALQSQQLYWNSGVSFNDKGSSQVVKNITDSAGNIYSLGFFEDSFTIKNQYLVSEGMQDVFVCKMDAMYNVLWLKSYGGLYQDIPTGMGMQKSGDIVFSYNYAKSIQDEKANLQIISLDANTGNINWQRQLGDTAVYRSKGFAIDGNNNIIIASSFKEKLVFNTDTLNIALNNNLDNAFFIKLDATGNYLMSKYFKGIYIECIDEQDGNIFFTGFFNYSAYFDTIQLSGASNTGTIGVKSYFAKLDSNFKVQWAREPVCKNIFGSGSTFANCGGAKIIADNNGNCYVLLGANNIDFQYLSVSIPCQSSGGGDYMLLKLRGYNGSVYWGKSMSVLSGADICNNLALNSNQDKLGLVGFYTYMLAIDKDTIFPPAGPAGTYLSIIDTAGVADTLIQLPIVATNGNMQCILFHNNDEILVGGSIGEITIIGTDTLGYLDTADAFIAKLKYTWPLSVPVVSHAAKDYTIYPNPSTGLVHIPNAQGIKRISLINAMGSMVWQEVFKDPSQVITFQLSNSLHKGLYYISIQDNSTTVNQKLVVE